ncbi:dihydroorotase [Neolewinella lacunae]|uniref:Dihydroorotase n=1 Tax=Neolewinella lacunae TaxID=1517758 RepID=A0A923PL61_9BACT|nr:dihydroorotase [Neolewinella lacunae]MBC6995399.1 dihydroorotase [Neolewinella lacunae]MDN3633111.1 dihydroorotase [Neolewinella lacunae]
MPRPSLLIKNGTIVNRGTRFTGDIFIKNGFIEQVGGSIDRPADREINAEGCLVLPGIIDDQVHFREPGLTHKATIKSESRAAVAGGTTTFMEMPNTKPAALTQELLADKYRIAAAVSPANYSFYMGASNDNREEALRTDPATVCGLKIFMGSSTGNMLVDDEKTLDALFANSPLLIATHCEDEATIRANAEAARARYGNDIPVAEHPNIRSAAGCLISSTLAKELALRHNTRLHILHISTADEVALFRNDIPLAEKRITAEVCVHHLTFNADDYARLGNLIKCNPAIKGEEHRRALLPALLDDRFDVIATDHAPHTWEEKAQTDYFAAPGGLPLVQHSLDMMMRLVQAGEISLERVVEKMSHAPAICFQIDRRGYAEEGMWADLIIYDPNEDWTVAQDNIFYKVGWSPLEGGKFHGRVRQTIVSGHVAYDRGLFFEEFKGERLAFNR